MKNLVMDYAKKNKEFDTALNELKKTYETEDVSDEVLADISGQLLGNQDFILNLSTKKPNIFKKMYDKIISIANKITGNSKEGLFIKDLKNKWESAYRTQNNNLNKEQKFSIQQDSNDNKYVEVDTDQDIFDGKSLSEQNKIAKKYILDNFRENGINVNNENIGITSKTANEYTHPRRELNKKDMSSKLRASTELDNLLSVSEYKYSKPDDGRHNIAKDGWDYYKVNFKVGNKTFEGLINIAKNGKRKTLYDITQIKKTLLVGSDYTSSTTRAMSSYANNIPQSDAKVKSNTSSTKYSMQESKNVAQELDNSSFSLDKQKQLEIIKTNNPVYDDYHTWIRNIENIKTLEETINDSDWSEYDEYNPDLTRQDIENAIENGKITVYSSYPIKQGIFVSPSKMEAETYSSNGKVYSKEVDINDVAWIDPTQGQYARVNEQFEKNRKIEYNNYENQNVTNLDLSTAQEGDLVNEFHNALTSKQWRQYHTKMNKIMDSTYGNLNRTDIINGKIICTEIKNHKEQVVNVLKINKNVSEGINYFIKEANKNGYNEQQVQDAFNKMYGEENVSRYDISSNKFISIPKLEQNTGKITDSSGQLNGETIQGRNKQNNSKRQELDNSSFSLDKNVKYSKENQTWQEYLEKNYKATGERTNMADLRKTNDSNDIAPVKEENKKVNKKLTKKEENIVPTLQEIVEQERKEAFEALTNDDIPPEIEVNNDYIENTSSMDIKSLKTLTKNMKEMLGLNKLQTSELEDMTKILNNL